jgi:iron complex transport system permease protein
MLILSGVAVNALFGAAISFLSLKFPDVLESYTAFSVGGFSGVYMSDLALPGVIVALSLVIAATVAPRLDLLCLGNYMARSLGVRVGALRALALILAAALAAASVSYSGLIGFVGLIVPHISKKLVGTEVKKLIPVAALIGAALLSLSDLFGRILAAPTEIPSGIITAFIGVPFFLILLHGRRKQYD